MANTKLSDLYNENGPVVVWNREKEWKSAPDTSKPEAFNPVLESKEKDDTSQILHIIQYTIDSIRVKKDVMDEHYSHVCFKCKKKLRWREVLLSNGVSYHKWLWKKDIFEKYKYLKKLWKSKYVQLYCCECFMEYEKNDH